MDTARLSGGQCRSPKTGTTRLQPLCLIERTNRSASAFGRPIWCLHYADARLAQSSADRRAPFRVAVTNCRDRSEATTAQPAVHASRRAFVIGQADRAAHLPHAGCGSLRSGRPRRPAAADRASPRAPPRTFGGTTCRAPRESQYHRPGLTASFGAMRQYGPRRRPRAVRHTSPVAVRPSRSSPSSPTPFSADPTSESSRCLIARGPRAPAAGSRRRRTVVKSLQSAKSARPTPAAPGLA